MTYLTVAQMSQDADLLSRVTACAAIEGDATPELWTQRNKWAVASQPGWGDAWDYAVNTGTESPGRHPSVITDSQILSAVQSIRSAVPSKRS